MESPDPFATETTAFNPVRVGRYIFRRPLAAGGLGVVSIYYDTELDREVALKEIRNECADELRYRQSFCSEAQITGILEHPGVVPVYSMGTAEDGRPYYAMRLITGSELRHHITQFHDEVKGGKEPFVGPQLRKLVQRLIEVCNVMHYAHSRGVLHRDLKSINVMLGKYGETIVIDWGLAKTTGESVIAMQDADESDATATERPVSISGSQDGQTRRGTAMGTISYAPPEQLSGRTDLIDARSDVYCLGSILYEILTGLPPCHGKSLTEALRAIESKRIPSPAEVQPRTPKPLSAIAGKALQPLSDHRYQSAKDLRNDLQRWLDDEPVSVYHESKLEQLSRWRRRHEVLVRWASLALAAITLISLVAVYQINSAKNEVELARAEATKMLGFAREATDNLLTRTSDRLEDLPGGTELRQELLKDAAKSYAQMTNVRSTDPALRRETARAALGLSEIQLLAENRDEGTVTLQRGLDALAGLQTREDQILRARIYTQLSRLYGEEQPEEAEPAILNAIEITRELMASQKFAPDIVIAHASAIWQRGVVAVDRMYLQAENDSPDMVKLREFRAEAIQAFETASDLLRGLMVESSMEDEQRLEASLLLCKAYNNEAFARSDQSGRLDARTEECYRKAIEYALPYIDNNSKASRFISVYALASGNLAEDLLRMGNVDAAGEHYQVGVEHFSDLAEKYHAIPMYKDYLALALIGMGNVSLRNDQVPAAIEYYQQAVATVDTLLEQTNRDPAYFETASHAKAALGSLLTSDSLRANQLLEEAVEMAPDKAAYVTECRISLAIRSSGQDVQTVRELASTLSSAENSFNVACIISRTCRQVEETGSAELRQNMDEYLTIAVERLRHAIALEPDLRKTFVDEPDLQFLRDRRGDTIEL